MVRGGGYFPTIVTSDTMSVVTEPNGSEPKGSGAQQRGYSSAIPWSLPSIWFRVEYTRDRTSGGCRDSRGSRCRYTHVAVSADTPLFGVPAPPFGVAMVWAPIAGQGLQLMSRSAEPIRWPV